MTTRDSLIKLLENTEKQLYNWWEEHKDEEEGFEYSQTIWGQQNLINDIRRIITIKCKEL